MHLICIGAHFKMFSIWITTYIARDKDRTAANIAVVYISELCYQLVRYDEQATAFLISN